MIDKNELLFVVDGNNNPLSPKPRKEVHKKGYWHRTAHIWVTNAKKELLTQKRSLAKDSSPGKWVAHFGGHMGPTEEYVDGAVKEVNEELGIQTQKNDLQFQLLYKDEVQYEFQGVFLLSWSGDATSFKFEKEEIDEVKWKALNEVYDVIIVNQNSDWAKIHGYEKELFEKLKRL